MALKEKKNKSTVFELTVKVWTTHIIALVCYLFVLAVVVPIFGDDAGIIVASSLTSIIYITLVYLEAWRTGYRDRNLIKYGRISADRSKGIKAALISQIPALIATLAALLGNVASFADTFIRYFYMPFAYVLENISSISKAFYILPGIMPLAAVPLGFRLGLGEYRISDKFFFARQGKGNDDLRK